MIELLLAALAFQANPYETVNPTIPYSRCMMRGLAARLPAGAEIEAARRVAGFEQALAECAEIRASALAKVDVMLSTMKGSDGSRPDPRFNGAVMMKVWDETFRKLALDPDHDWRDEPTGKPAR